MVKALALLVILLMTIGSMGGYVFLTEKITLGNLKIAEGQKQLEEGEQMLARGKAKLANGSQRLSKANRTYNGVRSIPFMGIANKLPISGHAFAAAGSKLSQGKQQVAQGREKIKAGEKQLAEGKLQLQRGIERLSRANGIRTACAIGGIFFGVILILLGYCWRQSVINIVRRSK